LRNDTVVASLDIVIRILEDPRWNRRAKKVRTLKEMRRMILDFCREKGVIVKVDGETCYTYV
jgi:very-short-patch-repair endonuclease